MFKWSQGFFNYNLEASNGVCSKTLSFHHQIVEGGKIEGEFETWFFFVVQQLSSFFSGKQEPFLAAGEEDGGESIRETEEKTTISH